MTRTRNLTDASFENVVRKLIHYNFPPDVSEGLSEFLVALYYGVATAKQDNQWWSTMSTNTGGCPLTFRAVYRPSSDADKEVPPRSPEPNEAFCTECVCKTPCPTGWRCKSCTIPVPDTEQPKCADCCEEVKHCTCNDELKKDAGPAPQNSDFDIEQWVRDMMDLFKMVVPNVPPSTIAHVEEGYRELAKNPRIFAGEDKQDKFSKDADNLISFIQDATKELLELFPEAARVTKEQPTSVSRKEIKKWLGQMENSGEIPSDAPEDAVSGPKPTGGSAPDKQIGSVLQEAHKIINGERQDMYGSPEDSFSLIARYWNTYLQNHECPAGQIPCTVNISDHDVAMMMVLLKIARQQNKPKRDNLVDAAGYIALAGEL